MENGDLINCDRCRALHRVSSPKHKVTGVVVSDILAFNCNGILRIASRKGVDLIQGLKVVEPVGLSGTDIFNKPRAAQVRKEGV